MQPVAVNIPRVTGRRAHIQINKNTLIPVQRIQSQDDLLVFKQTEAYMRLMDFIQSLNESVKNKRISDSCVESLFLLNVLGLLDTLTLWIDEMPPELTSQRFGNISFRHWIARLKQSSNQLLEGIIPQEKSHFIPELGEYLVRGFGDGTRLDYGCCYN
jgi:serine/threonine-protein phosphatase 2A activator